MTGKKPERPYFMVDAATGEVFASWEQGSHRSGFYRLKVPAGVSLLKFSISGGSGDADLYVRFGSRPSTSTFNCRPYKWGNEESCTFNNPSGGTWYVMVRGYYSFAGLTVRGDY